MRRFAPLLLIACLPLLGGCRDWLFDKRPDVSNSAQSQPDDGMNAVVANVVDGSVAADKTCASTATYDAIKRTLFDAARKKVTTNPLPLTRLQSATVIRVTGPLVRNTNAGLGRTECSGQIAVVVPPATRNAFGGSTELIAQAQYAVQPAADGSGVVVEVTGAETISDQLAAATDLVNQRKRGGVGTDPNDPNAVAASGGDFGLGPVGGGSAGGGVTSFSGKTYNPSFDCAGRLNNAMRMICQDEELASLDRAMAQLYARKKAATPKGDLPALVAAQRAFLKARDICPDTACMRDLYAQRTDALNADAGQ